MRLDMEEFKDVMTVREASEYLGVSADTLYKCIKELPIPAFKLGNRWRLKKNLLDRWMDQLSESALDGKSYPTGNKNFQTETTLADGTTMNRTEPKPSVEPKVPPNGPTEPPETLPKVPKADPPLKDPLRKDPPRKDPPKAPTDPPGPAPGV
jgi:excisionase family DNA binding protein